MATSREVGMSRIVQPLVRTALVLVPGKSINILPALYKSSAQAGKAGGDIVSGMTVLCFILCEFFRVATVCRCEGLIQGAEDKGRWIGSRVCRDQMELPLNRRAEVIKVEIVHIVIEGVFNFLTDFKESKKEERSKRGARNGDPLEGRNDLERQEEEIQPE